MQNTTSLPPFNEKSGLSSPALILNKMSTKLDYFDFLINV